MRRFILLILSALVCFSCENDLDITIEPGEDTLILNSRLESHNLRHTIFLSFKKDGQLTFASPLSKVYIRVNDGTEFEASFKEGIEMASIYSFEYQFKPFDKVEIRAEGHSKTATARVTFPSSVEGVNASSVDYNISLSFKDDPSATNYYRLNVNNSYLLSLVNRETLEVEASFEGLYHSYVWTDEPALVGVSSESGSILDDIMGIFTPENTTMVFTDESFSGNEEHLSFKMGVNWYDYHYSDTHRNDITQRRLNINLQHLSREDYRYFMALNAGDSFGFSGSIFIEPTIIPSNVEGGIGYVCAITTSPTSILLPDQIDFQY